MKQKFYVIKNLDNPPMGLEFLEKEGSVSFFSLHPMRKLGRDIKYTADLFFYSNYDSRTSCASKGSTTVTIYTYGEEQPLKILGWTLPNKYKIIHYTSKTGKVWFNMLSFSCKRPDGKELYVFFRTHDQRLDLLVDAIKTLTELDGYVSNSFSVDIYPGFDRY